MAGLEFDDNDVDPSAGHLSEDDVESEDRRTNSSDVAPAGLLLG